MTDLTQMLAAIDAAQDDEAVLPLIGFTVTQFVRIADALEKLAGVVDALPPPAPVASESVVEEPYHRPECAYETCRRPDCRERDECQCPQGWSAPSQ